MHLMTSPVRFGLSAEQRQQLALLEIPERPIKLKVKPKIQNDRPILHGDQPVKFLENHPVWTVARYLATQCPPEAQTQVETILIRKMRQTPVVDALVVLFNKILDSGQLKDKPLSKDLFEALHLFNSQYWTGVSQNIPNERTDFRGSGAKRGEDYMTQYFRRHGEEVRTRWDAY